MSVHSTKREAHKVKCRARVKVSGSIAEAFSNQHYLLLSLHQLRSTPTSSSTNTMAGFENVPKSAKTQPSRYKVFLPEERVVELRQLLKFSRIGPPTYENLHAEPSKGKFGLTRDWLVNAKNEWEKFSW